MIDIQQYRSSIGTFHIHRLNKRSFLSDLYFWTFIFPNFFFLNWILPNILRQCNDVEPNPGPAQQVLDIGHVNMRSVLAEIPSNDRVLYKFTKMDLLRTNLEFYKYGIIGISETWLDNSVDPTQLVIPGYHKPIRRDTSRHQGGSMVYIAENIPAIHKPEFEPTYSEIICVELRINSHKILICNCYRPQHRDIIDFCSDIESIIDAACHQYSSLIFMGDMNCRNNFFWSEDCTNTEGRALRAHFDSFGFEQLIHEPTRIVDNCKSCIDLIFTNNPNIFTEVGTRPKVHDPRCDHLPIYAKLKCTYPKTHSYKRWVWDYKRGDYERFRMLLLDAPWYHCYRFNNINDIVNDWLALFISIAETCIPHYEATIRPRDKEFMNSDIRKLMRHR